MAQQNDLIVGSLAGGFSDLPATELAPHQCTQAVNVDFWDAQCGARRLGCEAITLPSSVSSKDAVTFLYRHMPTSEETAAQLWALGASIGASLQLAYKDDSWHDVSFMDAATNTGVYPYQFNAQTLHGKLFLAYKSGVDRLHVWDGSSLRRTGLAEPAAPTAANTGSGSYSATRYFRVRYTVQSGGTTLRRSEPSETLTFAPSGTGSAVRVTKPASISESETHWEVEASLDNANFYRIATVLVGTTTYDDSTAATLGYADAGVLSDDIGDYSVIHSGKYLLADEDRLLIGGSFEEDDEASAVRWTPVHNAPGDGNDERLELDTDPILNLDGYEGGGLTGLAGPIGNSVIAFKRSHIYRLQRTGQREKAYSPISLTKSVGALEGSVVEAVDEAGRPALFFLDPKRGPHRIGSGGLLWAGEDVQDVWETVNSDAAVVSRALFDPSKQQIHWTIATGNSTTPSLRLTLQTNECRTLAGGVRFGWTTHTGPTTTALSMALCADNVDDNTDRSLVLKPVLAVDNRVLMLDRGHDDDGTPFEASIMSAPQFLARTLLRHSGIRAATIVGGVDADAVVSVGVVRDFGLETKTKNVPLAPTASETLIIKDLDQLALSECKAVQIALTDGDGNASNWAMHRLDFRPRSEQDA